MEGLDLKRQNQESIARNQYDHLFPKSLCAKTKLVYGSGRESAKMAIEWALKYSYQTKLVSRVLEKQTLLATINSIQTFLKDNIPYKSRKNHDVYSPACSWHLRSEGIECKNYSVFASSILINLGIKHFFRFVRYENENHVYIVIPKEQKKGALNYSDKFGINYYIIDGAGQNQTEQAYKFKFFDLSPSEYKNASIKRFSLVAVSLTLFYFWLQNKE